MKAQVTRSKATPWARLARWALAGCLYLAGCLLLRSLLLPLLLPYLDADGPGILLLLWAAVVVGLFRDGKKARWRKARTMEVDPALASARLATRKDLKKAGLL